MRHKKVKACTFLILSYKYEIFTFFNFNNLMCMYKYLIIIRLKIDLINKKKRWNQTKKNTQH
jgi:hypothetical protein